MSVSISILIADDHELIHDGISEILHNDPEFKIVANAFDGEEAVKKANMIKPDIILMDISMPKLNGIEATRTILQRSPGIKIIALSQHEENEYIAQMINAGCYGYLLKNSRKEEILRALRDVKMGKKYVNQNLVDKILSANGVGQKNDTLLTNREKEILIGIAEGKHNAEIADSLSISIRTVETHRRNIMQKLKVSTVVELLRTASKLGIIKL